MKTASLTILLLLAACGAPATQKQTVCQGQNGPCTLNGDCCSGFECVNSVCSFVGGVGGNPTGGGTPSGGTTAAGSSTGGVGGFIAGGSTGGQPGSSGGNTSGQGTTGGFGSSTGSPFGSSTGSPFGSSTGSPFTSSSSSSGSTGNPEGTSGGRPSSSSSSSGGSSTGGQPISDGGCLTELANPDYPAACADGGGCTSPLICVYDPNQASDQCVYRCNRSSDCPDIATHCVSGACLETPCGQLPDSGQTVNGTLDGPCNAAGLDDGTCIPNGVGAPGLCLQTGGTSTAACNSWTRCSDLADICETGWVCPSADGNGGPGTCEQLCNPSGANTCTDQQICVDQSDGLEAADYGYCEPDGGQINLGDAGLGICDGNTCAGCAAGEICLCDDETFCSAGATCGAGTTGICLPF